MDFSSYLVLALVCTGFQCTLSQSVIDPPRSKTVKSGTEVEMTCGLASAPGGGEVFQWSEHITSDATILYTTYQDKGITFPAKNAIGADGTTLIIKSAGITDGGRFSCNMYGETPDNADLVIMDTPKVTFGDIAEDQDVTLRCSVEFASDYLRLVDAHKPVLKGYLGSTLLAEQKELTILGNVGTEKAVINLVMNYTGKAYDNGKNLTCEVQTMINSPNFVDYVSVELNVDFAVRDIDVYPKNPEMKSGEMLNCTASGFPDVTYTWEPLETGMPNPGTVSGPTLLINDLMAGNQPTEGFKNRWKCVAMNSPMGVIKTVEEIHEFLAMVSPGGGSDEIVGAGTGDESVGSEGWIIAIAVIIPLICIGVAAVVGFMLWRRHKQQGGSSEPKPQPYPGGGAIPPEKAQYDNQNFQTYPDVEAMPDPVTGEKPANSVPVYPGQMGYTGPGAPSYPGRDSPGYGDLGIKHISPNGTGVNPADVSFESIEDSRPQVSMKPSYENQTFERSSPGPGQHRMAPADNGSDTAV